MSATNEPHEYTSAVGQKFHADGTARTFPGNTIICFVPPNSATFQQVSQVQAILQTLPFAYKFSFLPPASFHMTVMELLCDQVRQAGYWSTELALDVPLDVADDFFAVHVPQVPPPTTIRMQFREISPASLVLYLDAADTETAVALQTYRDAISRATGVRFPNHDNYDYHISLAYRLINLTTAEEDHLAQQLKDLNQALSQEFGIFAPPPPQLTFFDNMWAFHLRR